MNKFKESMRNKVLDIYSGEVEVLWAEPGVQLILEQNKNERSPWQPPSAAGTKTKGTYQPRLLLRPRWIVVGVFDLYRSGRFHILPLSRASSGGVVIFSLSMGYY